MFDTMTLTKIAAALCSALLVFVPGGWIADKIYSPAHHGEYHGVAWIETDSGEEEDEAEAGDGPMLEDLLASADLEKGAKVFKKCAACHKLEAGANGVGPHLYAVVDRAVGSVDGFGYSKIDHFDDWCSVVKRYKNIGRFEIPVDDPFLVSMLNSLADGNE